MYYSPLLCKPIPRSTYRAFEVKDHERQVQQPKLKQEDWAKAKSVKLVNPSAYGIEPKQGLAEFHNELASIARYDHPLHSPDLMSQMNLFATEACA